MLRGNNKLGVRALFNFLFYFYSSMHTKPEIQSLYKNATFDTLQ